MTISSRAVSDGLSLMVGSVVNGLAGYVFVVAAARYLGAVDFAPVSILWSFWALSVAMLTLPMQHWFTWRAAQSPRAAMGVNWRLALVAIGTTVVLAIASLHPRIYGSTPEWVGLTGAICVQSTLLGVFRGRLAALGRYRHLAIVIGAENVARVAALFGVIALGGGPVLVGAALLAGPAVIVFVPVARPDHRDLGDPGLERPDELADIVWFGIALALSTAAVQMSPALASTLGRSEILVTATFSSFALFRAPVLVAMGLSSRITAPLSHMMVDGRERRLRRIMAWWTAAAVFAAAVAALVAYAIGRPVVEALFGPGTALASPALGLIAAGMTLASFAMIQSLFFLTSGQAHLAAVVWITATCAGLVALFTADTNEVSIAFLVAEVTAVAVGTGLYRSTGRSRVVLRIK